MNSVMLFAQAPPGLLASRHWQIWEEYAPFAGQVHSSSSANAPVPNGITETSERVARIFFKGFSMRLPLTEEGADSRKERGFFFRYAEYEHFDDFRERNLAFTDFRNVYRDASLLFPFLVNPVDGSDDSSQNHAGNDGVDLSDGALGDFLGVFGFHVYDSSLLIFTDFEGNWSLGTSMTMRLFSIVARILLNWRFSGRTTDLENGPKKHSSTRTLPASA